MMASTLKPGTTIQVSITVRYNQPDESICPLAQQLKRGQKDGDKIDINLDSNSNPNNLIGLNLIESIASAMVRCREEDTASTVSVGDIGWPLQTPPRAICNDSVSQASTVPPYEKAKVDEEVEHSENEDENESVEDEEEYLDSCYYLDPEDENDDTGEHLTESIRSNRLSIASDRDSINSSNESSFMQDDLGDEPSRSELQLDGISRATVSEIDLKLVEETRLALTEKLAAAAAAAVEKIGEKQKPVKLKRGQTELIIKGGKASPLHLAEIMDEQCQATCWRYLEHCGGKMEDAVALMETALAWRLANRVDENVESELPKELYLQAPFSFSGRTKTGQEVLYVVGKNYRRPDSKLRDLVPKFSTSVLYAWDRRHRHDLEKFCIVFDVTDTGPRNIDLTFMSWLISTRDFLPNRIAKIYVVGIPMLVRPIIRLIISWLPEKFSRITHCGTFTELVEENIEWDQLPVEVGGTADEASYRRAPVEAPWADQTDEYSGEAMQRAINDCCGFHLSIERKAELRNIQLNYERQLLEDKLKQKE